MWETALGLLFLSAGYFFVSRWIVTKSISVRSAEHPQYFQAAVAGAALFVCASFALASLKAVAPWLVPIAHELTSSVDGQLLAKSADSQRAMKGMRALAVALLMAYLLPKLLNFPLSRNPRLAFSILDRIGAQGSIEKLIARTQMQKMPAMLSQESGKVYVGNIVDEDRNSSVLGEWIRIEPMLSGYRDEKQEFKETTDYHWLHEGPATASRLKSLGLEKQDFDVVIPLRTVISVRPFDMPTFLRLFRESSESDVLDEDGSEPMRRPESENPTAVAETQQSQKAPAIRRALTAFGQWSISSLDAKRRWYWFYCLGVVAILPALRWMGWGTFFGGMVVLATIGWHLASFKADE